MTFSECTVPLNILQFQVFTVKSPVWNIPCVKHGSILKVYFVVNKQHVSVLSFSVTEERSVHNLYLNLGLWKFPAANREQQHEGAEAAQQQHHAPWTHSRTFCHYHLYNNEQHVNSLLYVAVTFPHTICCRTSFCDWLRFLRGSTHRRVPKGCQVCSVDIPLSGSWKWKISTLFTVTNFHNDSCSHVKYELGIGDVITKYRNVHKSRNTHSKPVF